MKKLNLAKKIALSMLICGTTSCNSHVIPEYSNLKQENYINVGVAGKNDGATLKVRFNFPKKGYSLKSSNGVLAKVSNDIKSYAIYLVRSTDSADPTTTDPLSNALGPFNVDKTTIDVNSSSLTLKNVPPSGHDDSYNDYYYHIAVRAFDATGGTGGTGNELIAINNKTQGPWDGDTLSTPNLALSTGNGVRVDDQYNIVGTPADIDVTINLQDIIGTQVDGQITLSPLAPKRVKSYRISLTTDPTKPVSKQPANSGPIIINRDSDDFNLGALIHDMVVSGSPVGGPYNVTVEAFDGPDATGNSIIRANNGPVNYSGPANKGKEIAVSNNTHTVNSNQQLTFSDTGDVNSFSAINVNLGFTSTIIAGIFQSPGSSGSEGDDATSVQLNTPKGIALDKSGNIYIADKFNHKIRKLIPDGFGNFDIFTVAGTGVEGDSKVGAATDSTLRNPKAVAVDSTGIIYIADSGNNNLLKVDLNGNMVIQANNLGDPHGLTIDSTDNVYIADTNNNQIKKVTPGGSISTLSLTGTSATLAGPKGVAADDQGNLYIADTINLLIKKVSLAGGAVSEVGSTLPFNPDQITIDNEFGVIYITVDGNLNGNKNKIWAMRISDGTLFEVTASDTSNSNVPFKNPGGVAFDSSGVLFVADTGNDTLIKLY